MVAHCVIERAPTRPVAELSEYEIHREVVIHLRTRGQPDMVWWHTPNDAKRGPKTIKRLHAMGMKSGVHDLCFLRRGNFYTLKIKTWKGKPTAEQMIFASEINSAGGNACIVHDLDRALRTLERWNLLRGTT